MWTWIGCRSHGQCVFAAPGVFTFDDDNLATCRSPTKPCGMPWSRQPCLSRPGPSRRRP
ncbi:ferredoxin [Prauserella flavalba]|uniref:ferredoxin n=1 Tax=Prauserella flavalba TaxID=1477506 RepID=UPI0036EDE895